MLCLKRLRDIDAEKKQTKCRLRAQFALLAILAWCSCFALFQQQLLCYPQFRSNAMPIEDQRNNPGKQDHLSFFDCHIMSKWCYARTSTHMATNNGQGRGRNENFLIIRDLCSNPLTGHSCSVQTSLQNPKKNRHVACHSLLPKRPYSHSITTPDRKPFHASWW